MITYDNITLVPRVKSEIDSRNDIDTSVKLGEEMVLDIPLIAAPMPDVCGDATAFVLRRNGALGIIHRFQTIESQRDAFISANAFIETASNAARFDKGGVGCAIGVSDDYRLRYSELYNAGCRVFCVDTANGFNFKVERVVSMIKKAPDNVFIIAGNVATKEGYAHLATIGVDAVRVGIAGGSVCETRVETGVYMPTLESVKECHYYRERMCSNDPNLPLIIADGGIRTPSDMAKALAVGADAVMGGRIFAGFKESPGDIVKDRMNNQLYKLYRGAASHGVQKEVNGEKPDYNEGAEELVHYTDKSVATVVKRFKNGLRSTMSYMNAKTLSEFRNNVSVEKL